MSPKIRRNDPCPCGSGLKYKKCCLAREQDKERQARVAENAQQRRNEVFDKAITWLARHHEDAMSNAADEYMSAIAEDPRSLSEADAEYLEAQACEWVLAEGTTEIDGREVRLRDLVLEHGPLLDADQRRWLERSTEEPLRLWKVTRVTPGVEIEIEDLLDDSAERVTVKERSASRQLHRGSVIAARLGRWNKTWELAAAYPIPSDESLRLIEEIEANIEGNPSDPNVARATGQRIREVWVRHFTRRPSLPEIVDPSGERIEMTTDYWQVVDREDLLRRLDAQPDVIGSAGDGWARVDDPDDIEFGRTTLGLELVEGQDRLKAFARTRALAEEGRAWLEATAGPTLRYLTREIVDPTSERVLGGGDIGGGSMSVDTLAVPMPTGAPARGGASIPPEAMTQIMSTFYRKQYANLADDEIPILGNKSPRAALKERGGERKVRLWLEGFEHNEQKMATADGRPPVDLGFLWQALGLERDA